MELSSYIYELLYSSHNVNVLMAVFICIIFIGLYLHRSRRKSNLFYQMLNDRPLEPERLVCPDSGGNAPTQTLPEKRINQGEENYACRAPDRLLYETEADNAALELVPKWETLLVDGKRVSYKKKAILGIGATGTVFLVQTGTDENMALKEVVQMTYTETEKRIKVLHKAKEVCGGCDYLLKIHAVEHRSFMNCQKIFVLTEYCNGDTLRSRASVTNIPHFQLYDYMRQILSAVSYLHSFGIVHRDIKGDNIMLQRRDCQESLKIGDFDYSKVMSRANSHDCVVSAGYGTYMFMAPEVITGDASIVRIGRKADMWSVGCVLVEVFNDGSIPAFRLENGSFLWTSPTTGLEIAMAVASGAIPDAPFGPRYAGGNELARFYDCFNINPDDRPEAATLLADITTTVTIISDGATSLFRAGTDIVRLDSRYTGAEFDCVCRIIEGLIQERSFNRHPNIIYPVEIVRRFSYTSSTNNAGTRFCIDVLWEVPDSKNIPLIWRTERDKWLKSLAVALKDVVMHVLALDLHKTHLDGYLHFDLECFMHEATGINSRDAVCELRLLPFGALRSHRSMWSSHSEACWSGLIEFKRVLEEIVLGDCHRDGRLWLATIYEWVPWLRYSRQCCTVLNALVCR